MTFRELAMETWHFFCSIASLKVRETDSLEISLVTLMIQRSRVEMRNLME